MQVSRRHHFVPQFLLRQWYASDNQGFWLYFRDPSGRLRCIRKPAKSIAYAENLYSFRQDFPSIETTAKPDAMETEYFAKIDDDAAIVHQKLLIDDRPPLSELERHAWARFINSLLERNPQRIEEIERLSATDPAIQMLLRHPAAVNLREGFLKADLNAMLRNNLLRALRDFIDRKEDLSYLSSMKWVAFDITSPDEHFLTGDSPIVLNGGAGPSPIEMLSIAISPTRLLIMHRESEVFDQELMFKSAVLHSLQVTMQTQRHLVSSRRLVDGGGLNYARIAERLPQAKSNSA